jgi:2-oxoglutarate ferredoxin oxidoreductase subunit beta
MAEVMKANSVLKAAADRMSAKEVEGKIVVGEFDNIQKDEFTNNLERISVEKSGKKTLINSAYSTEL